MPFILLALVGVGGWYWYKTHPIWGLYISNQNPNNAYITDMNAGMDANRNQKILVKTYTINSDGSAFVVDDKGSLTIPAKNIIHF